MYFRMILASGQSWTFHLIGSPNEKSLENFG